MKILIIGDSHGHITNLKAVAEIARKSKIGAIIHVGDWNTTDSVKAVLDSRIPLYTVMGNADIEDGMEEFLKLNTKGFNPDFLKIEIDGRKIGITHKVKVTDKRFEGLDVVFSGHYHSKEEKMRDFIEFIRPGAPINGINFAVYDTISGRIKFVQDV